jgi:hypothetical protein
LSLRPGSSMRRIPKMSGISVMFFSPVFKSLEPVFRFRRAFRGWRCTPCRI